MNIYFIRQHTHTHMQIDRDYVKVTGLDTDSFGGAAGQVLAVADLGRCWRGDGFRRWLVVGDGLVLVVWGLGLALGIWLVLG